ncbi:MAG: phosphoglycerate dehydrogenase, partial [Candidatus Zixiibacteriota bacterium]
MDTHPLFIIIDDVHPILITELEKSGITCHYHPQITRNELLTIIHQYTGLVVRSKTPIDRELIDAASNLKIIGRYGAGMENIDTDYAESKGIVCLNAPEGNRNAVAEHTIGLLFALLNKICIANHQIKNGIWDRNNNWGQEITGKTIGIIGYGNTGSTFAKKLQGFDVTLLAYDKYKSGFGNEFVRETDMETIFAEADILSLHIPLTTETNNLVNRNFIEQFQKPFILLNTSRGQIVNTSDLVAAI